MQNMRLPHALRQRVVVTEQTVSFEDNRLCNADVFSR